MKNKHKDLKISFNDEFNKPKHDQEYYWNKGYNYSIDSVCKRLGVSKSFVAHTLLKEISSVVYHNKFIWSQNRGTCLTYVRKDELSDWIKKNAIFEVQTEIVDLSYFLSPYKDVYREAYNLYQKELSSNLRGFRRGILPPKVIALINDRLEIYGVEQNYPCDKRSRVPFKQIKGFDILEKKIYNAKDSVESRETIYRNAFLKGDIRVKISPQITIFVETKEKQMKMPYLIPYGKTIYVKRKAVGDKKR